MTLEQLDLLLHIIASVGIIGLIRAATDDHVWLESYNWKLNELFGVEG